MSWFPRSVDLALERNAQVRQTAAELVLHAREAVATARRAVARSHAIMANVQAVAVAAQHCREERVVAISAWRALR
jgi:hypothetical protein